MLFAGTVQLVLHGLATPLVQLILVIEQLALFRPDIARLVCIFICIAHTIAAWTG